MPSVMAGSLSDLAQALRHTLAPQAQLRAAGEKFLLACESTPQFSQMVLSLVEGTDPDPSVRTAAALLLKNYVRRQWPLKENESSIISDEDRQLIRQRIIPLLISVPDNSIRSQIIATIEIIASSDFPNKWPQLIQILVQSLNPNDFKINNAILATIHGMTKKYRDAFASNQLWAEIKHVLDCFTTAHLELFKMTDLLINSSANDRAQLLTYLETLLLLVKLFLSLNSQECPDFFAENLDYFFAPVGVFQRYLEYENPLIQSASSDEAGPLEKCKAAICEVLSLFSIRYEEDFAVYLEGFVHKVWLLLSKTSTEPKNDMMVSSAIRFLSKIAGLERYRSLFESPDTLKSICEKVVIPSMELRDVEIELFEDSPLDYIRFDFEGSNAESRRDAACELVRGLCILFEVPVTQLFSAYILGMLQQFNADARAWRQKDTAIFLLTALAVRTSTENHGTTSVNALVNLTDFLQSVVLPELRNPNAQPILHAAALKYIHTFRHHLPKEVILELFTLVVEHLNSRNQVVHTYAAICIEKMMTTRKGTNLVSPEELAPYIPKILDSLFKVLASKDTPQLVAEQEYLMRTIMRVIITGRNLVQPYFAEASQRLTMVLDHISQTPVNPRFNHYAFESIGALIRFCGGGDISAVQEFEKLLLPPFERIMAVEILEYVPYALQILAQLLDLTAFDITPQSTSPVTQSYRRVLAQVLLAKSWENRSHIPSLLRFLRSYMRRDPAYVLENVEPVLGIFHVLIATTVLDHFGMELVLSVLESLLILPGGPSVQLAQYLPRIFADIFARIMKNKTPKFLKLSAKWIYHFVLAAGPDGAVQLIRILDGLQLNLFQMVAGGILIPSLPEVKDSMERTVAIVAISRLICEPQVILRREFVPLFSNLLGTVTQVLNNAQGVPGSEGGDDNDEEEDRILELELAGYSDTFSQLAFSSPNLGGRGDGEWKVEELVIKEISTALATSEPTSVANLSAFVVAALQRFINRCSTELANVPEIRNTAVKFVQDASLTWSSQKSVGPIGTGVAAR